MRKVLTPEQIEQAKHLRTALGYSKRRLAVYFSVGSTTIWKHVYSTRRHIRKKLSRMPQTTCTRCSICEVCMHKELDSGTVPLNYQINDKCVLCYIRSCGLEYMDVFGKDDV